ncbi:hypothetical protein ALC57_13268 [Trachymyrmex cornetzi]|uniref:Uncharacterized protein n=1 Tax=Trachymyrmex cornetzi TaxID=471704 RepID=A0A151IZI8_9HYME|nr:hypothetical protein ALC57_13268 [Trachymyrmex cornetzi]
MSRIPCKEKVNKFCYICGTFEAKAYRREINDSIKGQFEECYQTPMKNLDKSWVPDSICEDCRRTLKNWNSIKKEVVTEPTVWPKYGKIVRTGNTVSQSQVLQETETVQSDSTEGSDDEVGFDVKEPKLFDQNDLDDLIRDVNLPKDSAELIASRFKERNLLLPGTKISIYRKRDHEFRKFFTSENSLVYCNDIKNLICACGLQEAYKPENWRLFIDSSKESLKAVLLHNGNKYAAISIGHSTIMKESYESFQLLLKKINYNMHKWLICGDFKMINILVGLQSGNTKNPCFLCLWDSRAREEHWVRKEWPKRIEMKVGSNNVIYESLVETNKILLPPLHIKLGLMKQFTKALNKDGKCFKYLQSKFQNLSDAKIKEGIFVGPDIRTLMKDNKFLSTMTSDEKKAWSSFQSVTENFLGNNRDPNYKTIVSTMLQNF